MGINKMKNCVICNKIFKPKYNNSQTCSKKCQKITKKQTWDKWYKKNKLKREEYNKIYRLSYEEEIKEQSKNHYQANRNKEIQDSKKYQLEHVEELKEYRKRTKEKRKKYKERYDKEHFKEQQEYRRNRRDLRNKTMKKYRAIPGNKIIINFRIRLNGLLKGRNKSKSTMELIGCSKEFLVNYIEKQFTTGMNWDNYGRRGWHVDHIKQCVLFDMTKSEDQHKCFHYTNLRPLWAEDNLRRPRK